MVLDGTTEERRNWPLARNWTLIEVKHLRLKNVAYVQADISDVIWMILTFDHVNWMFYFEKFLISKMDFSPGAEDIIPQHN